ncbi:hypothetical protein CLV43_1011014 [Umezawaea tangerina]|uniref:Uncharacterized protein n=1 Tax=Umezawaea tangerina TaxID=84725 RepID=A0A2T0TLY9_9PSEU|nr:hypothetical protein CLV43_1011014 [Umezawaea tangerina]
MVDFTWGFWAYNESAGRLYHLPFFARRGPKRGAPSQIDHTPTALDPVRPLESPVKRPYGSGGISWEASDSASRSKSTEEYSRSFVSRWKPSIMRTVPDLDRITMDCVVHPPVR